MDSFVRKIIIALEGSFSLEKRKQLISSAMTVEEIFENLDREPKVKEAEDVYRWLDKGFGKAVWYGESCFPNFEPVERNLPYVLFYKGNIPFEGPRITIVGTRFASEKALQRAFCLGLEAQANGIAVVTGMASGIDQASARGSLSALNLKMGCNMIGVLGCGLEVDYPSLTGPLKTKIAENGGTIISQFPPTEPGLKQNFPNRNLTMAALGNACIVVQAPEKSGSLITSDFALQMGKDVFVTDAGVENITKNKGSIILNEEGAIAIKSLSEVYELKKAVEKTDTPVRPFARYGEYNYTVKTL